jgi:SAM-dependent methyltransferase
VQVAPDGSPVELYELLPERGEGEVVARAVPSGGSILELGCGTGRITRQLLARGFQVTAVDESVEMLARVSGAETVAARIEELHLGRRFDAVLLAGNLITTEPPQRRAFLETCARHAEVAVVEMLPLGWQPKEGESSMGEVNARIQVERIADGDVHGEMHYAARGMTWRHPFVMHVFADEAELDAALREAGLGFDTWLDRDRGWFVARAGRARA